MISKAEREHLNTLKQWSIDGRAALREAQNTTAAGRLLKKLMPNENTEAVFDNIDWLVALLQRELHTQGVKNLLAAVEKKKAE